MIIKTKRMMKSLSLRLKTINKCISKIHQLTKKNKKKIMKKLTKSELQVLINTSRTHKMMINHLIGKTSKTITTVKKKVMIIKNTKMRNKITFKKKYNNFVNIVKKIMLFMKTQTFLLMTLPYIKILLSSLIMLNKCQC